MLKERLDAGAEVSQPPTEDSRGGNLRRTAADAGCDLVPPEVIGPMLRTAGASLLLEHMFVVPCFFIAKTTFLWVSYLFQVAFWCLSFKLQLRCFRKLREFWQASGSHASLAVIEHYEAVKERVFCVPTKCLGMKVFEYELLSLSYIFAAVLASGTFAGLAQNHWEQLTNNATVTGSATKERFQRNWEYVPYVGHWVGSLGPDWLVIYLLVWSAIVHFYCFFLTGIWLRYPEMSAWISGQLPSVIVAQLHANMFQSANFLFLSQCVLRGCLEAAGASNDEGVHVGIALLTKALLLWAKLSLTAAIWERLSWLDVLSTALALGLGFLTLWSLLPSVVTAVRAHLKTNAPFTIYLAIAIGTSYGFANALLLSHAIGIVYCPSHDFSMLQMRCM